MEPHNSQLRFNNYYIKEFSFTMSDNVTFPEQGMKLNIDFKHYLSSFDIKDDKSIANIALQIDLFKGIEKTPFLLHLVIIGNFESNILDKKEFEDKWVDNALAILFPYVREIISYITKNSKFPHLLLPTINVVETLKQKKVASE